MINVYEHINVCDWVAVESRLEGLFTVNMEKRLEIVLMVSYINKSYRTENCPLLVWMYIP